MRLSELLYQINAWALYSDLLFLLHLERKIDFLQLLTEESPNNIPELCSYFKNNVLDVQKVVDGRKSR